MLESAGPHKVLIETIDAIDRFALLYRLPSGKTVRDRCRPELRHVQVASINACPRGDA